MALKILSFSGTVGAISLLCRAAVEAIERGIEQITNASPERPGDLRLGPRAGSLFVRHEHRGDDRR